MNLLKTLIFLFEPQTNSLSHIMNLLLERFTKNLKISFNQRTIAYKIKLKNKLQKIRSSQLFSSLEDKLLSIYLHIVFDPYTCNTCFWDSFVNSIIISAINSIELFIGE